MGERRRDVRVMLLLGYANFEISFLFNLIIPLVIVLPRELGTTTGNASWVVTAFFVAGSVASPLVGRVGDLFGRRRTFVWCSVALLCGSAVCSMATNVATLIAGRMLQGMALPLLPLAMSMLREHVPVNRMPKAAGWAAAGLGAGGGLGLLGGGVLLDLAGWRSVFVCTLIVSLPLIPLALWSTPRDARRPRPTASDLDLFGAVGLAALLVGVLLPLSKGPDWGLSLLTVAPLAVVAALMPVWVRGRLRRRNPVIDLGMVATTDAIVAHLTAFAAGFSGFMGFVATAHVLQEATGHGLGFGLTLTQAGLLMTPATMSFLVTGPLAGRLMHTVGLRATAVTGGLLTCLGALLVPALADELSGLLIASFVLFVGNGILMSAIPVLVTTGAAAEALSSATGFNAFARTSGTALASSVFAAAAAWLAPSSRELLIVVQGVSVALVAAMMVAVTIWLPSRTSAVSVTESAP